MGRGLCYESSGEFVGAGLAVAYSGHPSTRNAISFHIGGVVDGMP